RVDARRRTPGMRARLEGHHEDRVLRNDLDAVEEPAFGMRVSWRDVAAGGEHVTPREDQQRPDPGIGMGTVAVADGDRLPHGGRVSAGGHYEVRRSIRYAEPACFLANSFISTATADASHWVLIGRERLVTTPMDMATTGNAYRSPRRSVTSMYPLRASAVS